MPITVMYEEGGKAKALTLDIESDETYLWESQVATHPVEGGGVLTDYVILANPKLTVTGYISNKPLPSTYNSAGAVVPENGLDKDNTAAGAWVSETVTSTSVKFDKKNTKLDVPGSKLQYNASSLVGAAFKALTSSAPTVETRKATGKDSKDVKVQVWKLNNPELNRINEALNVLLKLRESKTLVNVISDVTSLLDCVVQQVSLPRTVDDGQGATFSITFEQIKMAVSAEADSLGATVNSLVQKKKSSGSKATKAPKEEDLESLGYDLVSTTVDKLL